MNGGVIKCLIVDDDEISRNVILKCIENIDSLRIIQTCSSAIEASNILLNKKIDLIFLDVVMPGMSGFDLIKSLKNKPLIILTTVKKDYVTEAFEYDIVDYLVKPISYDRFFIAITKVKEILKSTSSDIDFKDHIFVNTKHGIIKIITENIVWVEAKGNYIKITTPKINHIVFSSMHEINEKLPLNKFVRVHRKYIINIDKIITIDKNLLYLHYKNVFEGGSTKIEKQAIPISIHYRSSLMQKLNLLKPKE
ncbi:response regulator transcription factor [Candidatus Amoebophilus asiaticus]|nr:response regulator transcription factor [Candidatus Amoebophilus asiaticus]